jgi:carbon storage regulator CsrA
LIVLVLTRKNLEAVVIGGAERLIKVTILEISGTRVALGFEVDKDIPVHRWEVYELISAGGRTANPNRSSLSDG